MISAHVEGQQLLQEIPQQFGDKQAWNEWLLSHFSTPNSPDAEQAVNEFLGSNSLNTEAINLQEIPQQFGDR